MIYKKTHQNRDSQMNKIIIALGVGVALCGYYLKSIKSRFYYYPMKQLYWSGVWEEYMKSKCQCITIKNRDGYKLSGVYFNSGKPIVIFCHGNAGNISNREHWMTKMIESKISFVLFDYMGFGNSEGNTYMESTYEDTEDVYKYVINELGYDKDDVIMMGESIGCFPATKLSANYNLNKLILLSGFHSISDVIYDVLAKPFNYLGSMLSSGDLNVGKYLKKNKGDVLILHSPDDTLISFENAVRNHNICQSLNSRLIKISGNHNNPYFDWKLVEDFVFD